MLDGPPAEGADVTRSRETVVRYVHAHPGSHFSAIVRALDIATGPVQFHLSRLSRSGDVESVSLYGRTHYYPTGYRDWEQRALALLRRETPRGIVVLLLDDDGRRPDALAGELGVARSTVEHHLDHLLEHRVVEKRRDDRGRVTVHLRRPGDIARLLEEVAPGVADRFVDRFMRLVDSTLEDV